MTKKKIASKQNPGLTYFCWQSVALAEASPSSSITAGILMPRFAGWLCVDRYGRIQRCRARCSTTTRTDVRYLSPTTRRSNGCMATFSSTDSSGVEIERIYKASSDRE